MPEPTEAERELDRLEALALEWDEEHAYETGELPPIIDALIAAAKRLGAEERDREWLGAIDGDAVYKKVKPEGGLFTWAEIMGYEPDGSGGWRKIGGEGG